MCTGEPSVSIDNVTCEVQDLSEWDMNACKIANVIIFLYNY